MKAKEYCMRYRQSAFSVFFDFMVTILTGGFWLIWVLIRYLRTH